MATWKQRVRRVARAPGFPLAAVAVALVGAGALAVPLASLFSQPVEQQMREAAADLNRSTPRLLDAHTRLDGAEVGPGPVFTYRYTAVTVSATGPAGEPMRIGGEALRERVCASPMRRWLDQDATVRYAYRDKDGKPIGEIAVTRADCLERSTPAG